MQPDSGQNVQSADFIGELDFPMAPYLFALAAKSVSGLQSLLS